MPRVAFIADSHFHSASRFEECVRVHDWLVEDMAARGVDLICHTGDVVEGPRTTPEERRAVAEWLQACAVLAPIILVRGNHDPLGDLPLFQRLKSRNPIIVEERAGVHVVGGCVVGCLAWPSKASVLAMGAESHAEGELLGGEALRNVLRGLGADMRAMRAHDGVPAILIAHAMVRGSTTSVGQPLVGCDFELGVDDLALAGADLTVLGHIHKGQDWEHGGAPIIYPGSPRRTTFGEVETKGYVVADFDQGRVTWELVPTPCAPMFLAEDEWCASPDGARDWLVGWGGLPDDPADLRGAEVRLRYRVPADMRDEARAAAEAMRADLLDRGAVHVKLDPQVIPTTTARAPEVARATTLDAKLRALWAVRGTTPDEARAARLLAKARELEEASRAV